MESIKELEKELQTTTSSLETQKLQLNELAQNLKLKQSELNSLLNQVDLKSNLAKDLEYQIKQLHKTKEEFAASIKSLEKEKAELSEQLKLAGQKQDRDQSKMKSQISEIEELKSESSRLKQSIVDSKDVINNLEAQVFGLQKLKHDLDLKEKSL